MKKEFDDLLTLKKQGLNMKVFKQIIAKSRLPFCDFFHFFLVPDLDRSSSVLYPRMLGAF